MNAPPLSVEALTRQSRQLGLLVGGIIALIAVWNAHYLWLGLAAVFAALGVATPKLLNPLTRLWLKLGELLARIMNPLILGILWLLVFTPMGLLRQWFGTDPMRRKYEPEARSYWIEQPDRKLTLEDFKRQF